MFLKNKIILRRNTPKTTPSVINTPAIICVSMAVVAGSIYADAGSVKNMQTKNKKNNVAAILLSTLICFTLFQDLIAYAILSIADKNVNTSMIKMRSGVFFFLLFSYFPTIISCDIY
jgi:hypothetical protein